jgi:hypothetical protein
MRFAAVVAVVLISGGMALSQKLKDPVLHTGPAPSTLPHSTVLPPPVAASSPASAAELARIEQQTARVRSPKPAAHPVPNGAATPALDLGKNKPVPSSRRPQQANPKN